MTEDKEANGVISVADFTRLPSEMIEYRSGDLIERSNFVPFLIKSFAISRGEPDEQYIYFRWLEDTIGFKWRQTFSNLLEAGGWQSFSDAERQKFMDAYKKIKKHQYDSSDFPTNPQAVFQLQITLFTDPDKIGGPAAKRYRDLELDYKEFKAKSGIPKTGTEFLKALKNFSDQ